MRWIAAHVWLCIVCALISAAPLAAQTQKAVSQIELTASPSGSEVGQSVTFTGVVTGDGGIPSGTVTFKDGETTLGTVPLSEGRAGLTTSDLAAGQHTITATYSGDDRFEGSSSPALAHNVTKASTRVQLTPSASASEAGQSVAFTAVVTGDGGVPTGIVTFKDGDAFLGAVPLSEGRARLATSALAGGQRTITATYDGDSRFRQSVSEPQIHVVQPKVLPDLSSILVLLAAMVGAAVLLLLRRIAFRWLLRPIGRGIRSAFRKIGALLRIGGRTSARQRPAKSFLGLGVGAITEAFTETEDAIAVNFDKSSVRIDHHPRLVCSWIRPVVVHSAEYDRRNADEDFDKAKLLFAADVPIDANPLNLYDDIHNAFIVSLFRKSDQSCFHVLSEFRRAINSNVSALAAVFSLIVSLVAVLNLSASSYVDFYHRLNLDSLEYLPVTLTFLGVSLDVPGEFNKAMFALISCAIGFGLMWMFYQMAYDQSQRYNGQQLNNFLVRYLADISIRFNKIHASATQAVVGDAEVQEMKHETVLWITNLHWMAFRVFFIEEFLRNILFQIRRNTVYTLFLVPVFFIGLVIGAAMFFRIEQFNFLSLSSNIYRQNIFYLVFPLLLYSYYRYLTRSLTPISESIEGQWSKFRELNVVDAVSRIMESYAVQLDQWRSRFKQGPGGAA